MSKNYSYKTHLRASTSLVTTYQETRAGFIALALEKNRLATPYIEQAKALRVSASQATNSMELLEIADIFPALLSAAGVSDKAAKYMETQDKIKAIMGLIEGFLQPAGDNFVDELVYRYLLTKGDALGGSMRNVGGSLAQRRLSRLIIAYLSLQNKPFYWKHAKTNVWSRGASDEPDLEVNIKGLSWEISGAACTILYNLGVSFIGNNIDLCLFNSDFDNVNSKISMPDSYIALGELKGGIDPAGADEHWKTAKSALERIRVSFTQIGLQPKTFFIGAAIASRMAEEIWHDLEAEKLTNAANLTNSDQMNSLAQWLCNL